MTYPEASTVREIAASATTRVGPATTATLLRRGGLTWSGIRTSPVELHRAAGLERDVYAAARCVASESPPAAEAMLSVAEVLRNEARAQATGIYQLLTFRTSAAFAWTQGQYGEQRGRFASTRLDPTGRTLAAARAAMNGSNLAGGAVRWFSPRAQDAARGDKDALAIVVSWGRQGFRWLGPLPNVDSYHHVCFCKQTAPTANDDLAQVVKLGRAGGVTLGPSSPIEAVAAVAKRGLPWWLLVAGVGVAVIA